MYILAIAFLLVLDTTCLDQETTGNIYHEAIERNLTPWSKPGRKRTQLAHTPKAKNQNQKKKKQKTPSHPKPRHLWLEIARQCPITRQWGDEVEHSTAWSCCFNDERLVLKVVFCKKKGLLTIEPQKNTTSLWTKLRVKSRKLRMKCLALTIFPHQPSPASPPAAPTIPKRNPRWAKCRGRRPSKAEPPNKNSDLVEEIFSVIYCSTRLCFIVLVLESMVYV